MTETRLRIADLQLVQYNHRRCALFNVFEKIGQRYIFVGKFSMPWEAYRLPPEHTCIGWYFEEMENAALAN